ncbi:MAG: bifunctional 3-deoxy-7-phosphoheptulonate synthase/chorismate mutase type II [Bacteroidales bacterium]|nr:bifunctional 3-deoxy-7-phosphoheptulonate synthase/chorismate mutase type II [Bacteroidales bacterium]
MFSKLLPLDEWGLFSSERRPVIISGPCSAESREGVLATARAISALGVEVFRAGAWKPRTSPQSFAGFGADALPWLVEARQETGLKVMTEVAATTHVEAVLKAGLDAVWVGARTTTNPFLVQEIAEALRGTDLPVLVKNPMSQEVALWLGAVERFAAVGLRKVGIIHRGFSSCEPSRYRNLPYWQIPLEIQQTLPNLPIFCDPSHIAGNRSYVGEIANQAVDVGFDGLMLECHLHPEAALSDATQQITPTELSQLLRSLSRSRSDQADAQMQALLDDYRARIDRLDEELLRLLAQRLDIAEQIGQLKQQHQLPVIQPDRWNRLQDRAVRIGHQAGLDETFVRNLFHLIHQASIERQF